MKIQPTGVVMAGICDVQTSRCVARDVAPITAVFTLPGRTQVNVCRPCLEEQIRAGAWRIEGARVRNRADVTVYNEDGDLELVVEVKRLPSTNEPPSRNWSRKIFSSIFAHEGAPEAPFFLLVGFPKYVALWKRRSVHDLAPRPDFEGNVGDAIEALSQQPHDQLSHFDMEKVVAQWLEQITTADELHPALSWMQETGLFQSIQHGRVMLQTTPR